MCVLCACVCADLFLLCPAKTGEPFFRSLKLRHTLTTHIIGTGETRRCRGVCYVLYTIRKERMFYQMAGKSPAGPPQTFSIAF